MDLGFLLTFLVIFHLVPLFSTQEFNQAWESLTCPKDFQCGDLGNLTFPFANFSQPYCGLCVIDCHADPHPRIKLDLSSASWFWIKSMSGSNFRLYDPILQNLLKDRDCNSFSYDIYPPPSPSISLVTVSNITLFRCKKNPQPSQGEIEYFRGYRNESCEGFKVYYTNPNSQSSYWDRKPPPTGCETVVLPIHSRDKVTDNTNLFQLLTADFDLEWHLSDKCHDCHIKGGSCKENERYEFYCDYADTGIGNSVRTLFSFIFEIFHFRRREEC